MDNSIYDDLNTLITLSSHYGFNRQLWLKSFNEDSEIDEMIKLKVDKLWNEITTLRDSIGDKHYANEYNSKSPTYLWSSARKER